MDYTTIVDALARVKGVGAVALGGSQSNGSAGPGSDHDIGVYYGPEPLDVDALDRVLTHLDDGHRDGLLNPPGAWGPWINGGAWLTVSGEPVDILLRDVPHVARVLDDCVRGSITIDYQCGHPFGFVNAIYAAETHYTKPLWQSDSAPLNALKGALHREGDYPPGMKAAIVQKFMWEAWFSLECTRKAARKGDVLYTAGSVFRAACAWAQVVYALNEVYLMNEKGALARANGFALAPRNMRERIERVYALVGQGDAEQALALMDALQEEMRALARPFDVAEGGIR